MSQPALPEIEQVTLRDGTRIALRPIRPEDAARLVALHARHSPASHYFRFFSARAELPLEEARELATVDYRMRMAIVALTSLAADSEIIGVARYGVANPTQPKEADSAIVVEDGYQSRGVGTRLIAKLIEHARARLASSISSRT